MVIWLSIKESQEIGGVLVSTWNEKFKEHVKALVLVKTDKLVIDNNYALAA